MPKLSIIIPCYNEQDTIELLLDALYDQTYPRSDLEVVIADGISTDHTRSVIAEYQASHPDFNVRVVDNPKRHIPAALNTALKAAEGEIIIRIDAHAVPNATYVQYSVEALEAGLAENVGGVWDIHARQDNWIARSIAIAAAHPLGVGGARYRYTNEAGHVDTVPFGAFYKHLVDRIGSFDERLLTNEDYEFNTRIRRAGGRIWLDPRIRSIYYARSTLGSLSRQYFRYGFWKARMLRRYPGTLRPRQALPPLFVLSLVCLVGLGFIHPIFHWLLMFGLGFYIIVIGSAGIGLAIQKKDPLLAIGFVLAVLTMHLSWGSAFLYSLVLSAVKRENG